MVRAPDDGGRSLVLKGFICQSQMVRLRLEHYQRVVLEILCSRSCWAVVTRAVGMEQPAKIT